MANSTSFYPHYPPSLTPAQSAHLVTQIKDWSIAHGLAVRPATSFIKQDVDPHMALATTAPVTVFPSLFPRACYHEALAIQTAYNELYAKISVDEQWLGDVVNE